MEIGLVGCTKAKEDSASTPRELYEPSALFRKARSYVEENHDVWYVRFRRSTTFLIQTARRSSPTTRR